MKDFFAGFKNFAFQGNVMDMAVGVVIGAAFGKIIASLVSDIIMPVLGVITGKVDFTNLAVDLGGGNLLTYGNFIDTVINFLIIALAIFSFIHMAEKARKRWEKSKEEEEIVAATPEELLTEIRDLLKYDAEKIQ